MMPPWPIPAKTAADQHRASDPRLSIWVRANAGSGKTYVLAQRAVRLLLAGVEPSRILCLTFTKAAAANMSARIFTILSGWTAMPDDALREAIRATGAHDGVSLTEARRLFARAVETPGGLKIQTIHAFCERLLHLFPFEANVAASFEALDDERKALLIEEAKARVMRAAADDPASPIAATLQRLSAAQSAASFDRLVGEALARRGVIARAGPENEDAYLRALSDFLGLLPGDTAETLAQEILNGGISAQRWSEFLPDLENGKANDQKIAAAYVEILKATQTDEKVAGYSDIFFTKDGAPRKKVGTASLPEPIREELCAERDRIAALADRLKAARLAEFSLDMYRLSNAVIGAYAKLKNVRGLLDFDDMIERTRTLLGRSDAAWVLYKLDAGIDHVLVDEAQDTSPEQWEIVNALANEFFAGEGARPATRTFFAVGDDKQSIFSFQGAAPQEFDANARLYAKWATADRFDDIRLKVSFRSVTTILGSVDAVFALPQNYKGLSFGDEVATAHEAWKSNLPGLVEIWQPLAPAATPSPADWRMPLDAADEHAPASVLAQRIAARISSMLSPRSGEAVHDGEGRPRAIRAGDIMILVRRRNAFFDAIIRALKLANVPVAGADRLKLVEHIAVMDLIAAGRAALLPEDDFTLACMLKSPLFGFDDDDLLRLAPKRQGSLLAQLLASTEFRDRAAASRIAAWSRLARTEGPFAFYARLLGPEGGRRALLSRIGVDAGDAIDEFLQLALEWESSEAASLTTFLHRMESADIEIKRDMENAGEAVRVMTVHAAKGLEAKIVFLPDTCSAPSGHHDPSLLEAGAGHAGSFPVWRRSKSDDPEAVQKLVEAQRELQQQEYHRLLYVAMTRAEERLYVCGYLGKTRMPDHCWYSMMEAALKPAAQPYAAPWGEGEILRIGEGVKLHQAVAPSERPQTASAPAWLSTPAAPEASPAPPIRPSRALDAADQFAGGGDPAGALPASGLAMLEGELIHALLQYLPSAAPERRRELAGRFLARRGGRIPEARRSQIAGQVLAVMGLPQLRALFSSQARAEAAVAGRVTLPNGRTREIAGRIDRIVETGAEVLIADFKSGRPPGNGGLPQSYVLQMALYRAALSPLFADKPVRALLIWTAGPEISEVSAKEMDAALHASV